MTILAALLLFLLCSPPVAALPGTEGCGDCPEMVVVPAGEFQMGASEDEVARHLAQGGSRLVAGWSLPRHKVTIARPFAIARHPVTRAQFAAFASETGHRPDPGCQLFNGKTWTPRPEADWRAPGFAQSGEDPVVCVSWHDAQAYVRWLNGKPGGGGYRLPTEAEWEYAARAGTTTPYSWGGEVGRGNAACLGCGSEWDGKRTAPAGSFPPNRFGLHDMAGNVWQWVQDCRTDSYAGAPADGAAVEAEDCSRGYRGGSWASDPRYLRSAFRLGGPAGQRLDHLGFRVARSLF